MWPFSKKKPEPRGWLTVEQARQVTEIYYAERDVGCWFACAAIPGEGSVRLATSTEQEAAQTAKELADEVFAKSGRRLPVRPKG